MPLPSQSRTQRAIAARICTVPVRPQQVAVVTPDQLTEIVATTVKAVLGEFIGPVIAEAVESAMETAVGRLLERGAAGLPSPERLAELDRVATLITPLGAEWMSVADAAALYGKTPKTIRAWIKRGKIEARRPHPTSPWEVRNTLAEVKPQAQ